MEVPDAQLSEYANEIHSRYNVQVSKSRVSSPDYNPIEYSFACLKQELKNREYNIDSEDNEIFTQEIIRAANKAIM